MEIFKPQRVWTVAEAKARLSEILRLAEVGRATNILEPGETRVSSSPPPTWLWQRQPPPRKPLGQWLIENVPRGTNLEVPERSSNRPIPFIDEEDE